MQKNYHIVQNILRFKESPVQWHIRIGFSGRLWIDRGLVWIFWWGGGCSKNKDFSCKCSSKTVSQEQSWPFRSFDLEAFRPRAQGRGLSTGSRIQVIPTSWLCFSFYLAWHCCNIRSNEPFENYPPKKLLSHSGNGRKTLAFRRRLLFDFWPKKGFRDSRILELWIRRVFPWPLESWTPEAIDFSRWLFTYKHYKRSPSGWEFPSHLLRPWRG